MSHWTGGRLYRVGCHSMFASDSGGSRIISVFS